MSHVNKKLSFRWWMVFSFLIYAISLYFIMSNDYNKDGHFMMSVSSTGLSTGESIGPSVIHWILFIVIALFGAMCATTIPPLIGLFVVPGPLWIIYSIINFILLFVSNVLWSIFELVFHVLFGWTQYVG